MKRLLATCAVCVLTVVAFAATVTPVNTVVTFTTNGDAFVPVSGNNVVVGVKLQNPTPSKTYKIVDNVTTTTVIWEHWTTGTVSAQQPTFEPVTFRIPLTGVQWQTTDTTDTSHNCYIYLKP